MPKVSIIMPAYNVENYIEESVASIRQQSFTDWELIVVNDGSTDSTQEILEKMKADDARIKIYAQSNQGVSAARNKGLMHAGGKMIAFLDGDDLWHPQFLMRMVNTMLFSGKEFVACRFNLLYPQGKKRLRTKKYDPAKTPLYNAFCNDVSIHIGSILVCKDLLAQFLLKFTEGCKISEDVEFIYKLMCIADLALVEEELMTYRKREGSATHMRWRWDNYITSIYAMERVREFAIKYYSHADKIAILHALHNRVLYLKADFLWKCVKFNEHNLALKLMNNQWNSDLCDLEGIKTSLLRKIKRSIVLTKNVRIWSLISSLTNVKSSKYSLPI